MNYAGLHAIVFINQEAPRPTLGTTGRSSLLVAELISVGFEISLPG